MSIIFKECITRPSLDSIFVFEYDQLNIQKQIISWTNFFGPKCLSTSYVEFITWREVIGRKEEIRPDIKYFLNKHGLFNEQQNCVDLNKGPTFNYFSLFFTQVTEFPSYEIFIETYESLEYLFNKRKMQTNICSNTRNTELWVDGKLTEINKF